MQHAEGALVGAWAVSADAGLGLPIAKVNELSSAVMTWRAKVRQAAAEERCQRAAEAALELDELLVVDGAVGVEARALAADEVFFAEVGGALLGAVSAGLLSAIVGLLALEAFVEREPRHRILSRPALKCAARLQLLVALHHLRHQPRRRQALHLLLQRAQRRSVQGRVLDPPVAQWTRRKRERNVRRGVSLLQLLGEAGMVEDVTAAELHAGRVAEGLHPADVAVVVRRLLPLLRAALLEAAEALHFSLDAAAQVLARCRPPARVRCLLLALVAVADEELACRLHAAEARTGDLVALLLCHLAQVQGLLLHARLRPLPPPLHHPRLPLPSFRLKRRGSVREATVAVATLLGS
mmetsp:Transcript_6160/g.24851  ORF Transcript_6160/g.24851 Transcript_6160/m.24851 type:complete len:353 (-) Transcript_6160:913-1971(-)